jgi:hemoglobin
MTDDFFTAVGGHDAFDRIVRRFYEGVKTDPILRPMYPDDDFDGAVWRLTAFLEQYWGGPTTYSEQRGHPRLRARHQAFRIDDVARDRWLALMTVAVTAEGLSPLQHETLMDYLDRAAHAMVNTISDIERDDRTTL